MFKIYALCLAFLYVSMSFAGTIDPNTPDSKYVEYGKKFKYVGLICGDYEDKTLYCGSAVAIDDHHVLTAAHVVDHTVHCVFSVEGRQYPISQIFIPAEYNEKKFGKADIALAYSDTSFGLDFYPALYTESDEVDKLCSMAGYGFYGTFLTGTKKHDGKKRAGSNFIDSTQEDLLICSPSRRKEKGFTSLEFIIGSGDSGGGLFIGNKLAGIHSCVIGDKVAPSSKYNEQSGHTRVSKFVKWINMNKVVEPQ